MKSPKQHRLTAAGISTFSPTRSQLLDTHKDIGTVAEVFRLSHAGKRESLMSEYAGPSGIGHVRYATCGKDDRSYAQPFERHHLQKHKWFSFAFNGQLANYTKLREELLAGDEYHLTRETDTEIIMHELSRELSAMRAELNLPITDLGDLPTVLIYGLSDNPGRIVSIFVFLYYIPAVIALRYLWKQMTTSGAQRSVPTRTR